MTTRWFITNTAMDNYCNVVGRDIDDDQVLIELEPLIERAHLVKEYPGGKQLWRGRAINHHRLRLIVAPPQRPELKPVLIAVLSSFGPPREHPKPP